MMFIPNGCIMWNTKTGIVRIIGNMNWSYYSVDVVMNDFLKGVYGKVRPFFYESY